MGKYTDDEIRAMMQIPVKRREESEMSGVVIPK